MTELSQYDRIYRNGGFGYANDREHHRAWLQRNVIEPLLLAADLPTCPTVLDAGCGDGFWSGLLDDAGCTVTGIDQSLTGITIARESYNGEFLLGDMNGLIRVDRKWDVVFARTLAGYFNSDDPSRLPYCIRNLAAIANHLLVLVVYTTRNGELSTGARMHPISTLTKAVERAGHELWRLVNVDDYVIMGIRP